MVTRRAFLTPDELPGSFQCRAILLPTGADWGAIFTAVLIALTEPENFEQDGELTPDETANEWRTTFDSWLDASICASEGETVGAVPIGGIIAYAGETAPENYLLCNGAEYDVSEFPALFDVILDTYGGDGIDTFAVPDLRARVPVGAGQYNQVDTWFLGDTGGEVEHTLTESEIPSHTHTAHTHSSNTVTTTPQATSFARASSAAQSGATGGGQPHENMPPFQVTNYIIRAE